MLSVSETESNHLTWKMGLCVYLWSLGRWFILVGMWAFTYLGCCHSLSVMLDFIGSGTKHHSCYHHVFLTVGLLISCLKLLGLDLPVSRHCILNRELNKMLRHTSLKCYFVGILFLLIISLTFTANSFYFPTMF